MNQSL